MEAGPTSRLGGPGPGCGPPRGPRDKGLVGAAGLARWYTSGQPGRRRGSARTPAREGKAGARQAEAGGVSSLDRLLGGKRNHLRPKKRAVARDQGNVFNDTCGGDYLVGGVASMSRLQLWRQTSNVRGQVWIRLRVRSTLGCSGSTSIRPSCTSFESSHRTMAEMLQGCCERSAFSFSSSAPARAKTRMWCQDSACHFTPVERRSPLTLILSFRLPMRSAGIRLDGYQLRDRLAMLGNDDALWPDLVENRQAPLLELCGTNSLYAHEVNLSHHDIWLVTIYDHYCPVKSRIISTG